MFTFNCKIDKENPIAENTKSSKKRKKTGKHSSMNLEFNKTTYPVSCSICSTEVGVYDSDEVYHFYNTIASY